jgi:hypothetical protein
MAYTPSIPQPIDNSPTPQVSMELRERTSDTPSSENVKHAAILKRAKKRFRICADAEAVIRKEALEDLEFLTGKQWAPEVEADRKLSGQPCLTINWLRQFHNQVANEERQNRPAIIVSPVGDNADVETAQVIQGMCRHVEVDSCADAAYDTAFQYQSGIGFGYLRVLTEYVSEDSFDQKIMVDRVLDPTTVYFDPSAEKQDYSDAGYCFEAQDYERDDYETEFPEWELSSAEEMRGEGDDSGNWFPNGKIRVIRYYEVEIEKRTLLELSDNTTVTLKKGDKRPAGEHILNERSVDHRTVKFYRMNATQIMEEKVWPSSFLPIIPALGEEWIVRGKRMLFGIVRFAKDAQQALNWARSTAVQVVALTPKAPYVCTPEQIEGFEEMYRTANNKTYPYLLYHARSEGGELVPPPQRQTYEPPIQAITALQVQAENDLKAVIGMPDASLGNYHADESGKAAMIRRDQGNTANLNFTDNLARSVRHLGRILVDMIPRIYDRIGRILEIVAPDGTTKTITIGEITEAAKQVYALKTGQYHVTVSTGPSYQTRRQEAAASMLEFLQHIPPEAAQLILDLLAQNMDWPGADEIAKRLKTMLPPQLQNEGQDQPQIPPAFLQQHQALVQAVQLLSQKLETEILKQESAERIAAGHDQATIIAAAERGRSVLADSMMKLDYAATEHRLDLLKDHEEIGLQAEAQAQQGQQLAQQGQQATQDAQQAGQQANADSGAQQQQLQLQKQAQDHQQAMDLKAHDLAQQQADAAADQASQTHALAQKQASQAAVQAGKTHTLATFSAKQAAKAANKPKPKPKPKKAA